MIGSNGYVDWFNPSNVYGFHVYSDSELECELKAKLNEVYFTGETALWEML